MERRSASADGALDYTEAVLTQFESASRSVARSGGRRKVYAVGAAQPMGDGLESSAV